MRLVHKQPIHTQLLKGHHMILLAFSFQLMQAGLQLALRALQLLDGKLLSAVVLQFGDALRDVLNLPPEQPLLPLLRNRDALKLAVADDDRVIIAGGNACAEFLPVCPLKILLGGNQDIGRRIQAQEL